MKQGGLGAKVKSKISGGTRSEEGRRAWDTFASLNLTCRRLGICFYAYLMDRFLGLGIIAQLGTIVRERSKPGNIIVSDGDVATLNIFAPRKIVNDAIEVVFNTS